jgi:hypothetical protein
MFLIHGPRELTRGIDNLADVLAPTPILQSIKGDLGDSELAFNGFHPGFVIDVLGQTLGVCCSILEALRGSNQELFDILDVIVDHLYF